MILNRRTAILGMMCAALLRSRAVEAADDKTFSVIHMTIPEGAQFEFRYGDRTVSFSGAAIMAALASVDTVNLVPVPKLT